MIFHEMSIEEMEADYDDSKCLLSEYSEVGLIDRIFAVGDDKFINGSKNVRASKICGLSFER